MAIRWAVATGNWSSTATWNGGTLPTSADDVFANNFTVNIDQDITASTLRNLSNTSPALTQGGGFSVSGNTGTRNITLSGTNSGGTFTSSGVWTLNSPTTFALTIASTSGATVNLSFPTGFPNSSVSPGTQITGNATVNYTGIMNQPGGYSVAFAIQTTAAGGIMNIVGNPIGSTTETAGINVAAANYTVNVTGNLIGGASAGNGNPAAVRLAAASTLNVTGNVTAAGTAGYGIEFTIAGSTANITGNVTAAAVNGIVCGQNNTIVVNGNVTSSSAANGIQNTNTSAIVTVNGNLTNVSDWMAVYSPKLRISPTTSQTWTFQTAGANRQMFTSNAYTGTTMPAASNVRSGVTYANGATVGTCAVPAAASVAYGVPVDNTTGTAVILASDLYSFMGALMAGYPRF